MKRLPLLIVVTAVAALILFIILFTLSYQRLGESIQQERIDYVTEISQQIITSQQFMKKEYTDTVLNYAGMLNDAKCTSLSQVRTMFSGKDSNNLMLLSTAGDIIDLDGRAVFMSDRQFAVSLGQDLGSTQMFTSLNNAEDFWLFAAPLEDAVIDGTTYSSVILAISADEFRDILAVSLFDSRGASYIINRDGSITLKPDAPNLVFSGYNLFASLLQAGALPAEVESFRNGMLNSESGSCLMTIDQVQWLISYSALAGQLKFIVVMVPLTITAAQTYTGLNLTIVYAALSVLVVALLALLCLVYVFLRDRERSRAAMAVAAKSDFFSKMSHDIRTPLNAIIGLEELAKDSVDNPAVVVDYLEKSSAAANYLLSLINDVLDMSRIESGKLIIAQLPFDMNQLLADIAGIIEATAAEKQLRFSVEIDSRFESCYQGDQVRLKQILMNLLSNAVKFTPSQGSVWLKASHQPAEDGCDRVVFVVRDTGIGISDAHLPRVFAPFEQERSSFTEQYTGSGLGLAIVHNLVSLMGGEIEAESTAGVGSSFTVRLSLRRETEETQPSPEKPDLSATSFSGRRVLLAEDNQVNQQIAVALLTKKLRMQVETACDGRQTLDLFTASPAGYYDLILMDVKMPELDGLEATRRIRACSHPDAQTIPIIALSANAFDEDVRLSLAAGMNHHLSKPINLNTVILAFRQFLPPA